MSGYCPEHGAYTTRRYETGCPVCSPDAENTRLRADLEAARVAINYATENILDYDDAEWAAWNAMPAVRAALGKDSDGDD